MDLWYVKLQLTEWGKYSRDPPPLRSNWRTWFCGPSKPPEMPEHIQLVDGIVAMMPTDERVVTIVHYCRTGTGREKAQMVGIPKTSYFRYLEHAHWFVHFELDRPPCTVGHSALDSVHTDLAVSKAR